MYILGISGLYHDSAAALIKDGIVLSAASEERFSRVKNDRSFPEQAIRFCLKNNHVIAEELEAIIFYDNPVMTLNRFMQNCLMVYPDHEDLLEWQYERLFRERLWIHKIVKEKCGSLGITGKLLICDHHISHAASAFYTSRFEDAAIMVIDAVGEVATTSLAVGEGEKIRILRQIDYPDSLGLLYSAFTYFCGFKVNSGEYKLMGLAPYGTPRYVECIEKNLIEVKSDGSYKLNLEYFDYQHGRAMTSTKFSELFGMERRKPGEAFRQEYLDMAASIQVVTENIILKMAEHLKSLTGKKNLCLAGGVALNCVANGVLLKSGLFEDIFIQPASGDAGGSIGAALYGYYNYFGQKRKKKHGNFSPYLGPSFSDEEIEKTLQEYDAEYSIIENENERLSTIADYIAEGKVVGFFQGAMEFGPRALGHRSILGDPRSPVMQSRMNLKIKFRESFRPFAPSILAEDASDYFDMGIGHDSPYMLFTFPVKEELRKETNPDGLDIYQIVNQNRSKIPAVTHVDYSARVQSVSEKDDSVYYRLLKAFKEKTGVSLLVNTSFNVRGEPIVCSPKDAYACFMQTDIDILVLEKIVIFKDKQKADQKRWERKFEND